MADIVDPATRSRMMSGIRGTGTKPERMVRSALHSRGFRFSRTLKLVGRPDAILPRWNVVIFVHGCFWHAHGCSLSKLPSSNTDFWRKKLAMNINRDVSSSEQLVKQGWRVATIWECAMRGRAAAEEFQYSIDQLAVWIRDTAGSTKFETPETSKK